MASIALVQPLKYREYSTFADVVGLYEGNSAFGILSHFLKSRGHEVIVCDCNLHEDYIGRFIECAPDFAGVRFEGYESETVAGAIKELKQFEPRTKFILGGPAVLLHQDRQVSLLQQTSADYLVSGDGIPALHDIAMGQPDSPGVSYLRNGELVSHGVAPYQIEAWQTDPQVLGYEGGVFRVIASIGCPHRCSFCDQRVYTPQVLYRPLSRVLQDMLELHRVKKAAQFAIGDPLFLRRKGQLLELDEGMRRLGLQQQITFQTRSDRVLASLEELRRAQARVSRVDLGVESFVQSQLDRWRKHLTVEQNLAAIEALRELGILPFLFLILGDLQSDDQEFRATLEFFCQRPEYLLITQPSGLVQYHDQRDRQYTGPALALAHFFSTLWQHVTLAWSQSSFAGFRRREPVHAEYKAYFRKRFENLQDVMREVRGRSLVKEDLTRLTKEAQITALLLGAMYSHQNPSAAA